MALRRIGFIGFGKMGTAFATGMINAGKFQQAQIKVFDPVLHNQSIKFNKASSNNDLAAWSDVIVLATKPKEISNVCNEISSTLKSRPIKPFVLSVAAGTTISTISQALQCNNIPIVRAMPNTPSLIGLGATAYFANEFVEDDEIKVVDEILDATGIAVKVENEGILDIVTAASGSGPAYFFLIMEHMIDSAVRLGLPREKATILVKQTCYGAGALALRSEKNITELREQVTSPGGTHLLLAVLLCIYTFEDVKISYYDEISPCKGMSSHESYDCSGTTLAGINLLKSHKLESTIDDAIIAAYNRSIELGKNDTN